MPLLAVVHRGKDVSANTIAAIIVRTPPFPVVVAFTEDASDPDVARCVVENLHGCYGNDITGFNADTRVVEPYVEAWSTLTTTRPLVHMKTRIYSCSDPIHPLSVPGTARSFLPRDAETVRELVSGFYQDAVPDEYDPQRVKAYVDGMMSADQAQRGILLWEVDREVVSMAAYTGATPHGIRVNAVYTPKRYRRHGYASACVAELTTRLLRAGRQFCFLFTDLSNPTSNKIYQEIGYRPVSDHVYWKFELNTGNTK